MIEDFEDEKATQFLSNYQTTFCKKEICGLLFTEKWFAFNFHMFLIKTLIKVKLSLLFTQKMVCYLVFLEKSIININKNEK